MGNQDDNTVKRCDIIRVTVLLTSCLAIQAMTTRILGIGLVCMVHPSALQRNHTTPAQDHLPKNRSEGHAAKFHWNYKVQSNIVAAHDWGELVLLPLAGFVINSKNVRTVLAVSIFLSVLCSTVFPLSAKLFDHVGASVSRFALGLTHAFSAPSIDASVAEFIPYSMRNTLYSVVLSGNQVASVFVNTVVAYYCHSDQFGGWPSGFYFVSLLGILWLIIWVATTYNSPKSYGASATNRKLHSAPVGNQYYKLITSSELWALLPCNVAAIWTTRLLMYYIPSFYRDVLRLPLMKNGIFSSLPFLTLCFGKIIFSASATWLVSLRVVSKNCVSKLFNTIALVGSGVVILCCTVTENTSSTNILSYVTLAGMLFSATSPGFRWSIVSLNRKYTALVSSTCTTASMIGAIIFPYVVSTFVKHGNKQEWHRVFLTVVVVDVVAALIYCILGSVEEREEKLFNDKTDVKPLLMNRDSESDD